MAVLKIQRAVGLLLVASLVLAQQDYPEYQDYADGYQQDNLYADYAARQDDRQGGYVVGFPVSAFRGGAISCWWRIFLFNGIVFVVLTTDPGFLHAEAPNLPTGLSTRESVYDVLSGKDVSSGWIPSRLTFLLFFASLVGVVAFALGVDLSTMTDEQ